MAGKMFHLSYISRMQKDSMKKLVTSVLKVVSFIEKTWEMKCRWYHCCIQDKVPTNGHCEKRIQIVATVIRKSIVRPFYTFQKRSFSAVMFFQEILDASNFSSIAMKGDVLSRIQSGLYKKMGESKNDFKLPLKTWTNVARWQIDR